MEADDKLAALLRAMPLKAGNEPRVRHRMETCRPELFGSPSPAPAYRVNKTVQKRAGRRAVFTLVEAFRPEGGTIQNLRFGTVFEVALSELVQRYPEALSSEVFDFSEEGKSAEGLCHLLSAWADRGEKLSFVDILKGASQICCSLNLDYSKSDEGNLLSGRLYSLEYSVFYPLLFASELMGSVRIQRCKLCLKPFICFEPNRQYCHRVGEEDYPELSCEEARKRIASNDSNYRRKTERKIREIRESHEQRNWSDRAYIFEKELERNRCELKGDPRKNQKLLKWLTSYENGLTNLENALEGLD